MPRARLVWLVVALGAGQPATLLAQRAVATSGLNVRRGQSRASRIVGHLADGDTVDLVTPTRRRGYLHVRAHDGTVGWSWAARLQAIDDVTPAAASASAVATDAAHEFDPSWRRVPTNAADYRWPDGNHAVCAASGEAGDSATNVWKNRTDVPAAYHPVTWRTLAELPFPHNERKHRGGSNPWSRADLADIARYEGTPIAVEGYLSGVKEELPPVDGTTHRRGRDEATNCGGNTSPRVDWHMYLTSTPHARHSQAIVVETTPRVRPDHPAWTLARMRQLVRDGTPVRISGWLMFDPEHWDQMWGYRGRSDTTGTRARITLWEIHPITKIEVSERGGWRSLDEP